ncbi:phosphoadenosine phosphosulfate reductase family protein [Paenibacillus tepidiphilus]|uniref:phosphoadenosine phosphosulfate reductase domain-containing protein n=1 Tax=Paenibacillus tepidiphilus TaxID=2608683 RepID=UPI00123C531A|nr:phosphoadenosine phosphosulfate reductase family protein [Paenibacillus tepidiphilus]
MTRTENYFIGNRHQVTFDISEAGEMITVIPKLFDRDLKYTFCPPKNYQPTDNICERSEIEWCSIIKESVRNGEIRKELGDKVLTSLERLPNLQDGQKVGVCFSGGKDSQAISILTRMKYPKESLFMMFADTKDEWPETYSFIPRFIRWLNISDFVTLDSMGIHKLLREHISCWPIAKRRHCTKNLKMLPMRDYLDEMEFGQVRLDQKPAKFRPSHTRHGSTINVTKPAPLLISGERHMEGLSRSNIPVEPERDELLLRMTARPVIEWSIKDIWEFLFWMKTPYNPVYHYVKRVACSGCPFAGDEEIYCLGKKHPNMLTEWAETERQIGSPRLGGVSFNVVLQELLSS